ncbi:MAG: ribosome maturation factor RimP [Candidatus Omnitrophota bacterium]
MTKEVFTQELSDLISSCLAAQGLELIELIYRPEGKRLVITVLADKPQAKPCLPDRQGLASNSQSHKPLGGITLHECAFFCRQLKNILEEKNIIKGDYVLEVSSPGLDRPLKRQKDFLYALNKKAVFFLNDLVNGKCQWQGVIKKVDEVIVSIQAGDILEIPLTKINKAQLIIE